MSSLAAASGNGTCSASVNLQRKHKGLNCRVKRPIDIMGSAGRSKMMILQTLL